MNGAGPTDALEAESPMPSNAAIFQAGKRWETDPESNPFGRCLVCGRKIGGRSVLVHADLSVNEVITADEVPGREALGHDVDQWSVGPECARLPEVAPFVLR